ncbi:4-hydroxy-tetrahydrodipicolinate synthase [Paenibacillus sp. BR2-3]|uniref:4-hydroxy-tetrahydrodipicolinate synthase n=1 Tax=Paenibacillus sp. BR2-3 TaxID=3048494 RepID=UPI003977CEF2
MFKGVLSPVITVVDEQGKIDCSGNEILIHYLVNKGLDGLLFFGTMGEFFAFTHEEKKEFIRFAVRTVNKRTPVLIGTGGTVIEEAMELTQLAEQEGADGVVVISPYYFKLDEDSLYRYFAAIAESTSLPVMLYNFPDRTNVNLSPELVLKLAKDFSNIIGIKDTVDSISHTRRLIEVVKSECPDFSVLAGFDEYLVPNLLAGGDGVLCGLTNIVPEIFTQIMASYRSGDFERVQTEQRRIGILMNIYNVSQPFVPAIKQAVKLRGLAISPYAKKPAGMLDDSQINQIKALFRQANIE